MNRHIAHLFLALAGIITLTAQAEIRNIRVEIQGDTLFVLPDDSTKLPEHIVIAGPDDHRNIYQRIYNDPTDDLMEDHPANDIYNNQWSSERVNPYRIPIDSVPDSTMIDLSQYCMPLPPTYITSKFGPRRYRYHYGTDLKLHVGDTVRAAFSGKVRITNYEARGYGYYVVIRHDNGLETVYAHLSRILVVPDQKIECGQVIGLGGNTGRSTGPHLHFETRYLGNAIDATLLFDFPEGKIREEQYCITKRNTFYHQKAVQQLQSAKYYTVRKGDTLGAIARRHGTTVNRLCQLNGIKPTKLLQIGQRLRVR